MFNQLIRYLTVFDMLDFIQCVYPIPEPPFLQRFSPEFRLSVGFKHGPKEIPFASDLFGFVFFIIREHYPFHDLTPFCLIFGLSNNQNNICCWWPSKAPHNHYIWRLGELFHLLAFHSTPRSFRTFLFSFRTPSTSNHVSCGSWLRIRSPRQYLMPRYRLRVVGMGGSIL